MLDHKNIGYDFESEFQSVRNYDFHYCSSSTSGDPFVVMIFALSEIPLKTLLVTPITLFGIVIEFRLVQPSKANLPISVTLSGIVTEVRLVHPLKAFIPISVTLSGIVIDVKLVQP